MATEQVVQPVPRRRMGVRSMLQEERVIAYIFVAPSLIVIAAIAFWPIIQSIWYSLLNYIPTYPQFGSKFVGLQNYVKVFQDTTFTSSIGKTAPFMALLLLAGLQVISEEVYEAGRVDGANVWQRFFRITLPLLKPAILVALLFRTLDAWRVFDMFFVVAGNRLSSISVYAYN